MTELETAASEQTRPQQTLDHNSATSAVIVGSVFVVIVGAAVLIGSFFRQHPVLMSAITIAAIVGLYLFIIE